jgi:hypothetical protein
MAIDSAVVDEPSSLFEVCAFHIPGEGGSSQGSHFSGKDYGPEQTKTIPGTDWEQKWDPSGLTRLIAATLFSLLFC